MSCRHTSYAVPLALLIAGCATKTEVRHDPFDRVEIAELHGNYVSGKVFGKTVLSLNPRRETRVIQFVTNSVVEYATNQFTTTLTNLIVTLTTNYTTSLSTNDNPQPLVTAAPQEQEKTEELEVEGGVTNPPPAVVVAPAPANLTNETVTTGSNISILQGNNQLTETAQNVRGLQRQVSIVSSNQTITSQLNEIVTGETNKSLTFVTNSNVTVATNVSVVEINQVVHDYYLFSELITPGEFTLAPNESLVLLIDGERHAFSATTSPAAFNGRKRFISTLYKVPPGLFEKIAAAKSVRVRLKGTNSVIERDLPEENRKGFESFLRRLNESASGTQRLPSGGAKA